MKNKIIFSENCEKAGFILENGKKSIFFKTKKEGMLEAKDLYDEEKISLDEFADFCAAIVYSSLLLSEEENDDLGILWIELLYKGSKEKVIFNPIGKILNQKNHPTRGIIVDNQDIKISLPFETISEGLKLADHLYLIQSIDDREHKILIKSILGLSLQQDPYLN